MNTSLSLRSILKSTSVYTILGFIPLSFGFLMAPIYTHYMSPEQAGMVAIFNLINVLFAQLFTLGIDSSFAVLYFDYYKDEKKVTEFVNSTFLGIIFIGSLQMLILLILGPIILKTLIKSSKEFTYLPFYVSSLVMSFCNSLFSLFLIYYRNKEDVKRYAIISLSAFLLSLFFSFLGIVVFNKQAQGAILARTLAIAIVVLITLIIQLSKGHVTFKMSFFTNSLQIGFPIFIYLIIGQLSVNIDRITVERVLSLRELGIYGIAITITTVVEIWITSVSNTTSPMIYKMFKNDTQENEQKVASILKWQFVSVLFVICILILMVTPVVRLMISKGYHDCIDLVPILALSFIGRILYISFVPVIFNLKKTKALAAINIFTLIVSIGVSWILAIYMGLIGIAIGTVISKFIPVPFVYFYSRKLHKMGYDMTAPYVLSVLIILATIIGIILKNTIGYYLAYSIPFLIFFPASLFLFRNEITLIKNHLLNHIKKQQ